MQQLPSLRNLALIRRAKGQTQQEVGDAAGGFSQSYISSLELGRRVVSIEHVELIARALGVEPEALTAVKVTVDNSSPSGAVSVHAMAAD